MAVTIRDVARQAGVSTSTVSIVYNGGPNAQRISAATRQKVEQVVRELNYEPNAIARSTSLKRFEAIGVALASDTHSLAPGRFYMQVMGGIGVTCANRNYLCVMSCVSQGNSEVPKFLRPRCVDMFLATHDLTTEAYARSERAGVPVMLVNSATRSGLPCVNFDEAASTRLTLDRLAAMGHRRIAYLSSYHNKSHYSHSDRMNAYIEWCQNHGTGTWIAQSGNQDERSEEDTGNMVQWVRSLLGQPEPVTAIVGYDSFGPVALMEALPQAGIRVPQQISLVTVAAEPIDPTELAGALYSPYELGRVACNEAIDALTEKRAPGTHLITATWRDGASAGPPAQS